MDDDYSTGYGGQGYPVNTAIYDLTGYGDIDLEKSRLLRQLLKEDPAGSAWIADMTNKLAGDPMSKYLNPGGPANLVAFAQDQYINQNRHRIGGKMTLRQGMNRIKTGG